MDKVTVRLMEIADSLENMTVEEYNRLYEKAIQQKFIYSDSMEYKITDYNNFYELLQSVKGN